MATNKVKCLCGFVGTASAYINHIGQVWREDKNLTLSSLQSLHKAVEFDEIIASKLFSIERIAQATDDRRIRLQTGTRQRKG